MTDSVIARLISNQKIFKSGHPSKVFGTDVNIFVILLDAVSGSGSSNKKIVKIYLVESIDKGQPKYKEISNEEFEGYKGYNFAIGYKYDISNNQPFQNAYTFAISWVNIEQTKEAVGYGCLMKQMIPYTDGALYSGDIDYCIKIVPQIINPNKQTIMHWVVIKTDNNKKSGNIYLSSKYEYDTKVQPTVETAIPVKKESLDKITQKFFGFLGVTYPFLVMFSNNNLRLSRLNTLKHIRYEMENMFSIESRNFHEIVMRNTSGLFETPIQNFTDIFQGQWTKDNPKIIDKFKSNASNGQFYNRIPPYYPITFFDFFFSEVKNPSAFTNQRMIKRFGNMFLEKKGHKSYFKNSIMSLSNEDIDYLLKNIDNIDLSMVEFCNSPSFLIDNYESMINEDIKIPIDYFSKCQTAKKKLLHNAILKYIQDPSATDHLMIYSTRTDSKENFEYTQEINNITFSTDESSKTYQFKQIYSAGSNIKNIDILEQIDSENDEDSLDNTDNLPTNKLDSIENEELDMLFDSSDETETNSESDINISESDSENNIEHEQFDDLNETENILSDNDEYHYIESLNRIKNINKSFEEDFNRDLQEEKKRNISKIFDIIMSDDSDNWNDVVSQEDNYVFDSTTSDSSDYSDDNDYSEENIYDDNINNNNNENMRDWFFDSNETDWVQNDEENMSEYPTSITIPNSEDEYLFVTKNTFSDAKARPIRKPPPKIKSRAPPKKAVKKSSINKGPQKTSKNTPKKTVAKKGSGSKIPKKNETKKGANKITPKPNSSDKTGVKKTVSPPKKVPANRDNKVAQTTKKTNAPITKKIPPKPLPKPPQKKNNIGVVGNPPKKPGSQAPQKKPIKNNIKKPKVTNPPQKSQKSKSPSSKPTAVGKSNPTKTKPTEKKTNKNTNLGSKKNNKDTAKDTKPTIKNPKNSPKDTKKIKKNGSGDKEPPKMVDQKKPVQSQNKKQDKSKNREQKSVPKEIKEPKNDIKPPKIPKSNKIIDFSKQKNVSKSSNDTITKTKTNNLSLKIAPKLSLSIGSSSPGSGMMSPMFPGIIQQPVPQVSQTQIESPNQSEGKKESESEQENTNENTGKEFSDNNKDEPEEDLAQNTKSSNKTDAILSQIFTLPTTGSDIEDSDNSNSDENTNNLISLECCAESDNEVKEYTNTETDTNFGNEMESWANSLETTNKTESERDMMLYTMQLDDTNY